jgi:hypothetical protein
MQQLPEDADASALFVKAVAQALKDGSDTNVLFVDNGIFPHLDELAPGLFGYTVEYEGALYVPLVVADDPGHGACSRYLDSLPRDRTIKFPTVISSKLEGALQRRGFTLELEYSTEFQTHVDVYVRRAL